MKSFISFDCLWTSECSSISSNSCVYLRHLLHSSSTASLLLLLYVNIFLLIFSLILGCTLWISILFERNQITAIEWLDHKLLKVYFASFEKLIKLILLRKFDDLNHFSWISDWVKNIQVVEVNEIYYLPKCFILNTSIKIYYQTTVVARGWYSCFGWLRSYLFLEKLSKVMRFVSNYGLMSIYFCIYDCSLFLPPVVFIQVT